MKRKVCQRILRGKAPMTSGKGFLRAVTLCAAALWAGLPGVHLLHAADTIEIGELRYTDAQFNRLYQSTVASKNRILKDERLESYPPPTIYRYTLQRGEDIWTIIAKTSLNVGTIATLNRIDFIGMLKEGTTVYLPDLLGLFFEVGKQDRAALALRYGVAEEDIQTVEDPLKPGGKILFVPEVRISYLERTYLLGVVFYSPLMGVRSSSFGRRVDPFINEEAFHGGVDIAADAGKKVHAARWGRVIFAGEADGYGNTVLIEHELGYHTLYAHLDKILVEQDQDVESGSVIGTVGSTGRSTGPHLHFEIRRYEEKLNPENIPFFLDHQE
jgi:murein DD-endopeptidase MepM/ murein hydrolase activator NlpD